VGSNPTPRIFLPVNYAKGLPAFPSDEWLHLKDVDKNVLREFMIYLKFEKGEPLSLENYLSAL